MAAPDVPKIMNETLRSMFILENIHNSYGPFYFFLVICVVLFVLLFSLPRMLFLGLLDSEKKSYKAMGVISIIPFFIGVVLYPSGLRTWSIVLFIICIVLILLGWFVIFIHLMQSSDIWKKVVKPIFKKQLIEEKEKEKTSLKIQVTKGYLKKEPLITKGYKKNGK